MSLTHKKNPSRQKYQCSVYGSQKRIDKLQIYLNQLYQFDEDGLALSFDDSLY